MAPQKAVSAPGKDATQANSTSVGSEPNACRNVCLFPTFPCVCHEPVLAKPRFYALKWHKKTFLHRFERWFEQCRERSQNLGKNLPRQALLQ
jgi:hypothetical protein